MLEKVLNLISIGSWWLFFFCLIILIQKYTIGFIPKFSNYILFKKIYLKDIVYFVVAITILTTCFKFNKIYS